MFLVSYFDKRGAFFERYINIISSINFRHINNPSQFIEHQYQFISKLIEARKTTNTLSRPIKTWYFDHILNPYARIKWQIDSSKLIKEAALNGFILQSSCPSYTSNINVDWYKNFSTNDHIIKSAKEFITRNSLSFMFGGSMFFFGREKELSTLDSHIQEVISIIAKLETKIDIPDVHLLITKLNQVKEFIIRRTPFFPTKTRKQS